MYILFIIIGIIILLIIIVSINSSIQQNDYLREISISQIDNMNGYDFEYYVSALLTNQGYSSEVTTASNDLGVDIVAKKNQDKYAIQVKRYSNKVSRKAVSDAVAGMKYYKCNKSMVVTNNYYTKGAYNLAAANSCILIDRKELGKWVYDYQKIKDPKLKNIQNCNFTMNVAHKKSKLILSTSVIVQSNNSITAEDKLINLKEEFNITDKEVLSIARKEYPKDKEMQNEEYMEQLKAKLFMSNIEDTTIKFFVQKEYPKDFCLQENEYKEQIFAKEYMISVSDNEIKRIALIEYPNDFSMQVYIYKEQSQAKKFMLSCQDNNKKIRVQKEYPNDYSMQEYEYRNQI